MLRRQDGGQAPAKRRGPRDAVVPRPHHRVRVADARRGVRRRVSMQRERRVPGSLAAVAPRAARGAHPAAHGTREGTREADIDATRAGTGRSGRAEEARQRERSIGRTRIS